MELHKEYFSNCLSVSYSNVDPLMIMQVSVGLLFLFLLAAAYLVVVSAAVTTVTSAKKPMVESFLCIVYDVCVNKPIM